LTAQDVRSRVLASWDDCTEGRLCYAAPLPPVEEDRDPYGVAIDAFKAEFPAARGRVDVEMDRCPGAIPWIVVRLNAGESSLSLPSTWRGFPVVQRGPVAALPFGQTEESEPPATEEIPPPDARAAEFPIGPTAVVLGVFLGVFVLSFFVKQSPAGRWYFNWRDRQWR